MQKTITKKAYDGINIENAMLVGFASEDLKTVNSHFGGAKNFMVYKLSKEGFELEQIVKTDTSNLNGDDKTDFKLKALSGIHVMYCESIGGTAAAKAIRTGINLMKVEQTRKIEDILNELVLMVNENPPPWIKKIMNIKTIEDTRLQRWTQE